MAHYTIRPVSTGSFAEAETSLLYYLADDRNAGVKIPAIDPVAVLPNVDPRLGEEEIYR